MQINKVDSDISVAPQISAADVPAEFGYGGKLLHSFPNWLIDGRKPSRLAWLLKEKMLPPIYWKAMLRGREWLAKPTLVRPEVVN